MKQYLREWWKLYRQYMIIGFTSGFVVGLLYFLAHLAGWNPK